MSSQEDITHQQTMLHTHRQTLAIYLGQIAKLGSAYAPPGLFHGIAETRAEIRRIKALLRDEGAEVGEHPDDEEPGATSAESATASEQRAARIFLQVSNLLQSNKIDDAEQELARANHMQRTSTEYWFWKSLVALGRNNAPVALNYIEKALNLNPRHVRSLVVKIKLLLLRGGEDIRRACELAEQSYGVTDDLDAWLDCLTANGVFTSGPWSNHELDMICPFPS
jgi:tetratricopeptide (TPR) repeat protein